QLGRNLTALAREGDLDPVVGRAREMEEVLDVLGKRRTNNPCLVGEPGVGKTAVVEGVAQRLLSAPGELGKKVVVELSTADLLAGTSLRGSLSERLNGLKEEMRRASGRVVVFLDEIHTLVGAGSTGDGAQDAANELKGALARGGFRCIGARPQAGSGASTRAARGRGGGSTGVGGGSPRWRRRWGSSPGCSAGTRSTTGSATPARRWRRPRRSPPAT